MTKQQVRAWTSDRAKSHKPLPDQKEMRRQLGIDLEEAARPKDVVAVPDDLWIFKPQVWF